MAAKNHHLQLAEGAMRVPETQKMGSVKLWCEYAIWGLLFYDDQSPWLTLTECLHICFARKRLNLPIFEGVKQAEGPQHETVAYGIPLNNQLRHLLFRDKEISRIASGKAADVKAKWAAWFATVDRDYEGLELRNLQGSFDNFQAMARSVELLRTSEIEAFTSKRWTSRHVLPLGSAMVFPDVNSENSLDRKFMRRTGEMLYLMLNRSGRAGEVEALLDERLLGTNSVWNRLAGRLAGPDSDADANTTIGYLPMPTHRSYDRLADDWVALLSLSSIPVENVLDPLERVSGLIQALYILERAQDTVGDGVDLPPFFLDVVGATGNNAIRKLSSNQYKRHRTLPFEAAESFIDAFAASDEWKAVLASDAGRKEAADLLAKRFFWSPQRNPNPDTMPSPENQLAELRADSQRAKGHHIGATFHNHVKQIGLLRTARRAGTWYAPNDAFLEALVLANVTTPMEFGDFLDRIMRRYNIVVGPEETRTAFQITSGALPAPLADLKENERRLEERLRVLGFVDRKSDDCAFVVNPFHDVEQTAGTDELVHA
jgi:hypothetical protein